MRGASKPTLVLGIPTLGMHSSLFTKNLMGMVWPTNFALQMRDVYDLEVGRARNILVQEAKALDAKYLMFWDEDVIAPAYGAKKLIYHLDNHPDWSAAAGVYATKSIPPEPLVYREWAEGVYWGWKVGELIKVKATGMGFIVLRIGDLEKIPAKEYQDRSPWTGGPLTVQEYFNTGSRDSIQPSGVDIAKWTEDMFFWRLAEEAGLQVYVDTDVLCHHYDKTRRIFYDVPRDGDLVTKPDPWRHEPRICELGAGAVYDPHAVLVDLRDEPHITYRCDVRALPQEWTEQFDIVRSRHVLEHFGFQQTPDIMREWVRIVKPGGVLYLETPDLQWAAERVLAGDVATYVLGHIFGDQGHPFWMQLPYGGVHGGKFYPNSYENNHHRAGFTAKTLGVLMQEAGLVEVHGERRQGILVLEGTKPKLEEAAAAVEEMKGDSV